MVKKLGKRNRKGAQGTNRRRNCNSDNTVLEATLGNGNGIGGNVVTEVGPTETIVNTRTNVRTVRRIHPTHIRNVNRNITRVENYYPVTESLENENIVMEFDCGSNVSNSKGCKPRKKKCRK